MFFMLCIFTVSLYASEIELSIIDPSASTPTRQVCDAMIDYFFKGNAMEIRDHIKPHLQKELWNSWNAKKVSALEQISSFENMNPKLEKFITKKVSIALEGALKEEHETRVRYQAEAQERLSKSKAVIITSICSLLTAAITAGVTIAVTLSNC